MLNTMFTWFCKNDSFLTCFIAYFSLLLVQNSNLMVQQSALKHGALPLLLRLLSKHEPMAVRKKAMYALSSLIRLFLVGQKEFLKLNGLEMFVKLFNEANTEPLVIKAITLMTDILTEQIEYVTSLLRKQGQDVSGDISGRYGLCFFL